MCVNSSDLNNRPPQGSTIIISLYKWENWGTEGSNDLTKIKHLLSFKPLCLQNWSSMSHHGTAFLKRKQSFVTKKKSISYNFLHIPYLFPSRFYNSKISPGGNQLWNLFMLVSIGTCPLNILRICALMCLVFWSNIFKHLVLHERYIPHFKV